MRLSFALLAAGLAASPLLGADLRLGIIGCDTSHALAFTELLNNPQAKGHVPGGQVVAAYKGGSPDNPSSWSRVEGYSRTLREKYHVQFYDTIEELCTHVDAVLLESVDGRPHLAQVKPVLNAHKPVFVDKPIAASLSDTLELFRLAREKQVPLFSSSGLRFAAANQALRHGSLGRITYCETYGPCEIEPHHPDLFWYGVRGVEALFTVMGTGCQTVRRDTTTNGLIEVIGTWSDGREGVFREDDKKGFHGLARGEKGEAPAGTFDGYAPLVQAVMHFFQTGVAPVQPEETIEIIAFMQAADVSKAAGGAPVDLPDLIRKAAP